MFGVFGGKGGAKLLGGDEGRLLAFNVSTFFCLRAKCKSINQ